MNTMKLSSVVALVLGCAGWSALSAAPVADEGSLIVAGNFLGRTPTFGHKAPDTRRQAGERTAIEGGTRSGVSTRATGGRLLGRPPTYAHRLPDPRRQSGELAAMEAGSAVGSGRSARGQRTRHGPPTKR